MITIEGVRINNVTFTRDSDGKEKMSGNYSLVSSNGKVIAKQDFNEYSSSLKIEQTGETAKLVQDLYSAIKKDIEEQLGLKDV
jgi:hypothetical protein